MHYFVYRLQNYIKTKLTKGRLIWKGGRKKNQNQSKQTNNPHQHNYVPTMDTEILHIFVFS